MDLVHERRLRDFQAGKPQMTVAIARTSDEVVFFPTRDVPSTKEAQAAYRELVGKELRCVVPSCDDSLLTAVFRREGTNHFRHLTKDVLHDAESLLHHMGKRVLAHWAAQQPGWSAAIEQTAPDGTCRPDVTLTAPDGRRQALEVQYSSLDHDKFLERNEKHQANEFAARVWFLGSRPRYYRHRQDGRLKIHRLGRQILDNGGVLLWLNPQTREVVTAYDTGDFYGPVHPAGDLADAQAIVPLDECTLDPIQGVLTPKLIEILAATRAREEAIARRRARQELQRQQAQEEQQRREDFWENSDERRWILRRHDGQIPPVIATASTADELLADRFGQLPVRLKARIYMMIATSDDQLTRGQVHYNLPGPDGAVVTFDKDDWAHLQRFLDSLARERLIGLDMLGWPPIVGPVGMKLVRPKEEEAPPDPRSEQEATLQEPEVIQIVAAPRLPPPPPPTDADLQAAAARVHSVPAGRTVRRRGIVARVRQWWRRR
jgi:hypothetical protein